MKKVLLLLVFSVIVYGCSKDVAEPDPELQDFIVTLNVDPNYRLGEFVESFRAFLSDQDGTILDSAELQVGQASVLSHSGDPSAIYDLSYVRHHNLDLLSGEQFYTLITYTHIDQGEYHLGPSKIIESSNDDIFINLENTGYPCEVTSGTVGIGSFGPDNGGFYKFRGNMAGTPTSDFYISFKSPNDQFERYFWEEDIPEGTVFNGNYNELPEIQNSVNIETSPFKIYNLSLDGLISGDAQNIHHGMRLGNYPEGRTSLSIPMPSDVFDNYLLRLNFGNDDFQYFKNLNTTTIPPIVSAPELGFAVSDPSQSNFRMTTRGNAVIYQVIYRESNPGETVSVSHSINGEVTPEVVFSKENLRMNIQHTYPGLTGFETLHLGSISLMDYSAISSYQDILKYRIEQEAYEIPDGGFIQGVSKQFD